MKNVIKSLWNEEDEFIRWLSRITIIAVGFPIFLIVCPYHTNSSPGTGSKIGQIVRLNRVGIFWKTWEAELLRGGFTDGSGTVGTAPFHFTIESDAMAEKAKGFLDAQSEVILDYRIKGVYNIVTTESGGVFATEIKTKNR